MLGNKITMESDFAARLLECAEARARELGVRVSVAVVDDGGKLKSFARMDGATNASVDIALAKATHAIDYQRPTKYHEDVVQGGGYAALTFPGFLAVEGGVPISVRGEYVGAIGVSGAQSEQDGDIAKFAADSCLRDLEAGRLTGEP